MVGPREEDGIGCAIQAGEDVGAEVLQVGDQSNTGCVRGKTYIDRAYKILGSNQQGREAKCRDYGANPGADKPFSCLFR